MGWPMIRRRNLKLLGHWIGVEGVDALYDLESDPGETTAIQAEMDLWIHASR